MMPLNKIFQAASKIPQYFKIMNEYSFGEKVYRIIKEDKEPSATQAMSKIADVRSEFGSCSSDYIEKRDKRDVLELFLSI